MREPKPWIIEQLLHYLDDKSFGNSNNASEQRFGDDLMTKQLKNELMDIIESQYFQQTLFEIL